MQIRRPWAVIFYAILHWLRLIAEAMYHLSMDLDAAEEEGEDYFDRSTELSEMSGIFNLLVLACTVTALL